MTPGSALPALVSTAVPLVLVKAIVEFAPVATNVIPAASLKAFAAAVLIVRVKLALTVSVPVKPVQSTPWIVIDAEITDAPLPLLPSNIAKSDVPGTVALFAPPDVADQLVLAVAFQLVDAPPPTQYRFATDHLRCRSP